MPLYYSIVRITGPHIATTNVVAQTRLGISGSDCVAKNKIIREYMVSELSKMGLRFIPTSANFIYFSLEGYRGDYFARLKSANIEGTKIYEEQGKWTRITLGTMGEMQKFIHILTR